MARLKQEVEEELDRAMGEFTFDLQAELDKTNTANKDEDSAEKQEEDE